MKKPILIIGVTVLISVLLAQEISHDVSVINIEVPVRVFKGSKFVDNLTMKDFEVYEDGKLQKIEAVYLVKKSSIKREEAEMKKEEARKKFVPQVTRNFVLLFEITEYLPKIEETLDYFFKKVITPGDTLMVVTPVNSYKFNKKALEIISREEIANRLNEILRKDITLGSREYKSLFRDYENIYLSGIPLDLKLSMLKNKVREIKDNRYLDEKKLKEFARYLKNMEGQKYAFLFYQKELMPFPGLSFESFEYLEMMSEIMSFLSLDLEKIKQDYADSSISIHFLYITNTQTQNTDITQARPSGLQMLELSVDTYNAFNEISKATGGLADSSANIASSFKKAVDASENYYLLYYAPKDYRPDGKFKTIEVKIPDKNYSVTHRAGYVAN